NRETLYRSAPLHKISLSSVRYLVLRCQVNSCQVEQVVAQPRSSWGQEPCQGFSRTGRERPLLRNRGSQYRSHRQASALHRKAPGVIEHVSPGKVGRTTHHREIGQRQERTQPSKTERHRAEGCGAERIE